MYGFHHSIYLFQGHILAKNKNNCSSLASALQEMDLAILWTIALWADSHGELGKGGKAKGSEYDVQLFLIN